MMGEPEWRMPLPTTSGYHHLQRGAAPHLNQDVLTRLAVSPCKTLSGGNNHASSAGPSRGGGRDDFLLGSMKESRSSKTGSKKASAAEKADVGELDCTTSGSSSSNSGIDYKRRHRCTLPSITTTSTFRELAI